MNVDRERARSIAVEAFVAHGISRPDAEATAEMLVTAEARGKSSHGLIRLPRYLRGVEHGNVDPAGTVDVVHDAGAAATIDGGARLGPAVADYALEEAATRADEHGIGLVGVRNATHLGMLGYYTDRLRKQGYVAVALTNTEPAMPPYGGAEPVLGTNPIAIGLPSDPPFNLDMSTSAIARGSIDRAAERGESIPDGVALDANGEPTTDPEAALEGTILPFGGPKGSGLAIAVEILAGALVGAATGTDVTGTYHTSDPCTKGDLFVAIDPEATAGGSFSEETNAFLRSLKRIETEANADEIRLPGETSLTREADDTIDVAEECWTRVLELANAD
ncbi:Ldh family oxidoreductase [Halosolutus halophilus]|uniref:Ldh family oxidoreductase n=1 Tax=Halosolutus halophilus TaxID=1552990 RepID=UPI0022350BCC|nr:Ldh family oxidoreductase [Halosolutus halophilus]